MTKRDYYEILNVSKTSTAEEIKKAHSRRNKKSLSQGGNAIPSG